MSDPTLLVQMKRILLFILTSSFSDPNSLGESTVWTWETSFILIKCHCLYIYIYTCSSHAWTWHSSGLYFEENEMKLAFFFFLDKLQIRLSFAQREPTLHMPPPYSIVIQVRWSIICMPITYLKWSSIIKNRESILLPIRSYSKHNTCWYNAGVRKG